MEKRLQKVGIGIGVCFAMSFMLFLYEPLMMYFTNMDDFWFDFHTIIGAILITFLIVGAGLALVIMCIYVINEKVYKYILLIGCVIFFALYIQGNFLVGNLPPLDGTTIDWSKYGADNLISVIVFGGLVAAVVVGVRKWKIEKVLKATTAGVGVLTMIMGVLLVFTMLNVDGALRHKDSFYVSDEELHNISTEQNVMVLLLDSVESVKFNEIVKEHSEYESALADFTYFPDTMSGYAFTRDSLPFILSGVWNENKDSFADYYKQAMENSALFDGLEQRGYGLHYYGINVNAYDERLQNLKTGEAAQISLDYNLFVRQEMKYLMFKYLPFCFKPYSNIETLDFELSKGNLGDSFEWSDVAYYNALETSLTKQEKKNFQFLHLEGAHVPFNLDKDLNAIQNGNYEQKLEASFAVLKRYVERLRQDEKIYDKTAIVIMSDHGYSGMRQNPIFYVKGVNEHHEMETSEKPVSYAELTSIFLDLADGKRAEELLNGLEEGRGRRFLYYDYGDENHMVEYEQTGKAWDTSTMRLTGKEFNR